MHYMKTFHNVFMNENIFEARKFRKKLDIFRLI